MRLSRLLPLALLALPGLASALSATYRVTQNVGSLSLGQPEVTDPYLFLDFQLTDGTNAGNGNSKVEVSNLKLSGGSFDFSDSTFANLGNVSGSGNSFTLRDGLGLDNATAERTVLFRVSSASAVLTYDFTLTSDGLDAPTPDGFNVSMLYRTGMGRYDLGFVTTTGPTGSEMVSDVFDGGATTQPTAFGVDPTFANARKALGDDRFTTLGAPVIGPGMATSPSPVPAPSAIAAFGVGLLGAAKRRRKA